MGLTPKSSSNPGRKPTSSSSRPTPSRPQLPATRSKSASGNPASSSFNPKNPVTTNPQKPVPTSTLGGRSGNLHGRPNGQPDGKFNKRFSAIALGAIVLGAAGVVAGATWLGGQLMVNPQALVWINQLLPDWIPISVTGLKPPQTLSEIQAELQKTGLLAGEPIELGKNQSFVDGKSTATDLLLPVRVQPNNCQSACDRIVELRLYQSTQPPNSQREPYYQLVNLLPVQGLEESFAIGPLVEARSTHQGSARALPMNTLSREKGPGQGVWLNLSGQLVRGNITLTYGRVLHYNPQRFYLGFKLDWTSPIGPPVWQPVTNGGAPELVVDQTLGLEPQFKIYQVKPLNFQPDPVQLELISLWEPTVPGIDNALLLARNGLWSQSVEWLQSLKRRSGRQWAAQAQAQLDLIQRHASVTQAQANQSWSSPSQQVLANLVDGRWARALQVFSASPENSRETVSLLKADTGRLQNRVEAALQVNPRQREAKAWNALIIGAQRGKTAAIAWLKKQPQTTPTDQAWIVSLLARLDPVFGEANPTIAPVGKVLGTAQPVSRVNLGEWQRPKTNPAPTLESGQVWYQVQISQMGVGKGWRSPAGVEKLSPEALWKQLGLTADPMLQLLRWLPDGTQETVAVTVQAVRRQGNEVQLLASGDAIAPSTASQNSSKNSPKESLQVSWLAFTDYGLQWIEPTPTTIAAIVQQQPAWGRKVIASLTRELKRGGILPAETAATWEALNQQGVGDWSAQQISLTGRDQPDTLLTIDPSADSPTQVSKPPRTLIFSATGSLLYSEFSDQTRQTFLAIADLGDGGTPAIVTRQSNRYTFWRWSTKRQQFEQTF